MARRDDDIERDRNDEPTDAPDATGDILGISRVPVGGAGEIQSERGAADTDQEERITPVEDSKDLGARDVTHSPHGQTGPETGGHGSTPQRSGATGSDVGS